MKSLGNANPKDIKISAMDIPVKLIEELEYQLPDVKTFEGYHYDVPFVYNDHHFQITYYKVTQNNGYSYFWLCNPFNAQQVIKNGSWKVQY